MSEYNSMLLKSAAVFGLLLLTTQVEAQSEGAGWSHYGGDAGGRHYSYAQQINRDNVDDLDVAWVHRSGDMARYNEEMLKTSTQSTPILLPPEAGEALVYCTPFNRVIALDPGTGEQRWDFDPNIDRRGDRPFRCRGVSYLHTDSACEHRLFMATHDRRLWALNAKTGQPCEDFGEAGSVPLYGHETYSPGHVSNSSAPAVSAERVIVGSTIIDFASTKTPRGTVAAFDPISGKRHWQFDPLVGNDGSGSANVWAPISVDEDNGLVFLPTSAPSVDYYGAGRAGDNRYANSLVALDLTTGEVRWHFQHVHHDLWDYDSPAQPILFDWQQSHPPVPAVAQLTKQGFVFVFNRLTGEPLWEIREVPVPASGLKQEHSAPTQPMPVAPPPLVNAALTEDSAWGLTPLDRSNCAKQIGALNNQGLFTPLSEQLTLMFPGSLGGANWGGGGLDEDSGLLIVNVNNVPFTGQLIPTEPQASEGEAVNDHPGAGHRMRVTMSGTPYDIEIGSLQSMLGIPCNAPPWGKLIAVDLYSGDIKWEVALGSIHEMGPFPLPFHIDWGTPNLGGGIATAGGLFFIGSTMDRQIRAFDSNTGATLWKYTLPIDATATPMTYTYRGRQFVVINAGGHHMFQRGVGDYLYAFALDENRN